MRSGAPGVSGRVTYALTQSRDPVVMVIVRLNGTEVLPRVTGIDLRQVAGSYFTLPSVPGSYGLSVSALTASGCEDGASRPMTVVVQ